MDFSIPSPGEIDRNTNIAEDKQEKNCYPYDYAC